ncbi:MAG: glycine--tRNA ligase [Candidatus Altiarchaeota archaeon]|nr:glycine--tRNA ligase [Candidatus Altiarchaeota archaeon]
MTDDTYEKILDISRRRGIAYPSFEIYGGLSGFIDYGPVGSRIKQNVENLIRKFYVIDEGFLEVQCPTLSPEQVWIASGHVQNFKDFMTECQKCGEPYRADHLVEQAKGLRTEGMGISELQETIAKENITCPKCKGRLDSVYNYNLMFPTHVGPGKGKVTAYLRPETSQTTYLSFRRLWEFARKKLPFGVLQIGRSFRNEISPRQMMIRLREFNQAEIQVFVDPGQKETPRFSELAGMKVRINTKDGIVETTLGGLVGEKTIKVQMIAYYLGKSLKLFEAMGIKPERLQLRQHEENERAFYSSDTWDVEYVSPSIGRIELVGIADRSDYDLSAHMKLSKQDMSVNIEGRKFVPHVVEIAYGIDRPIYCLLESCLSEEADRTIFKFTKEVAPYTAGIFPLTQKDGIPEKARAIFTMLRDAGFYTFYDESGSIGKKYARADEIGVPYCITVDYDTLKDDTVTVRERDGKSQKRVKTNELVEELVK